jgi:CheY-like chemotaxis protein
MSPDEVGGLFQPFRQAATSQVRGFGGTGLGLAISQRLAHKLGGAVSVRSAAGAGSTFTLTVAAGPWDGQPYVAPDLDAGAKAAGPVEAAPTPAAPPRLACRLLLAEDNRDNQRVISLRLTMAGADVTLASNGSAAIELTLDARDRGRPFDVILMDMQMPVLDGYEATRLLRAEGVTTPIFALTAHAMSDEKTECLRLGCDEFISKPIDWKTLIESIEARLKPASRTRAEDSTDGDAR